MIVYLVKDLKRPTPLLDGVTAHVDVEKAVRRFAHLCKSKPDAKDLLVGPALNPGMITICRTMTDGAEFRVLEIKP